MEFGLICELYQLIQPGWNFLLTFLELGEQVVALVSILYELLFNKIGDIGVIEEEGWLWCDLVSFHCWNYYIKIRRWDQAKPFRSWRGFRSCTSEWGGMLFRIENILHLWFHYQSPHRTWRRGTYPEGSKKHSQTHSEWGGACWWWRISEVDLREGTHTRATDHHLRRTQPTHQ